MAWYHMAEFDGGDAGDDEVELSLDAVLDLLSHHHRRTILRTLRERGGEGVPLDEVVSRLREREARRTGERPSWDHISATLHHVHNPKLADSRVVDFDESEAEYRYRPDDRLERWLELVESEHDAK